MYMQAKGWKDKPSYWSPLSYIPVLGYWCGMQSLVVGKAKAPSVPSDWWMPHSQLAQSRNPQDMLRSTTLLFSIIASLDFIAEHNSAAEQPWILDVGQVLYFLCLLKQNTKATCYINQILYKKNFWDNESKHLSVSLGLKYFQWC